MADNWENYRDWKELQENMRKKSHEDDEYDIGDDDDVQALIEILRDYSE